MKIQVIDSHTGGEPTRVITGGWDFPTHEVVELRRWIQNSQMEICHGILAEPRGSSAWVGAALVPAQNPKNLCGVVYFNTRATLGMCGHGTIGLVETLRHLGRYQSGSATIETPAGEVQIEGHEDGSVELRNVAAYVYRENVSVNVPTIGVVTGDIAWGGNWFFLVTSETPDVKYENREVLLDFTRKTMQALFDQGIRGKDSGEIDHVEVFGPSTLVNGDSKNFVLCPSGDYDRSPCGTGTSAKLAWLYSKGKLREGELWVQESITGSAFVGSVEIFDGQIRPRIRGAASIMGEGTLYFKEDDLFRWGIR